MPTSETSRRGFALPAVLAVTGVVTLIFLVAITALSSLNAETRAGRDRVRFLQAAMTLEATVTYMAATEPLDARGLMPGRARFVASDETFTSRDEASGPEVRLDGRAYTTEIDRPLVVRLQDEAGLINLAQLDAKGFTRFLEMSGGNASDARTLFARFQDYTDADNLRQPNGAEAADYGRAAIGNRKLLRPGEWLGVLGARAAIGPRLWRAIRPEVVSDPAAPTYNVNTATSRALQVHFGLSPRQAESAIRARESRTFLGLSDLVAATGVTLEDEGERFYAFPSGRIVYEIRDAGSAWVYRGRISLTPRGLERPFWVDQTELLEASGRTTSDTSDAVELPYAARAEDAP